mgnify:CR=1 FL=1|jgi:TPR repeat protein
MNEHIELVKKWLADPSSVTQEELEYNKDEAMMEMLAGADAEMYICMASNSACNGATLEAANYVNDYENSTGGPWVGYEEDRTVSDYDKGIIASQSGDYTSALEIFTSLAEMGHADAQFSIGIMHNHGQGVPKSFEVAVTWFQLAAEQGHAEAQFSLGVSYAYGEGVIQNAQTAVKWYTLAAEQGHASSQYGLALMYDAGDGVAQDNHAAERWYHKAAVQGHGDAQYSLGQLTLGSAMGLQHNYNSAKYWYTLSAEQGYASGQFGLGFMFANGLGVPQSYETAVKWYTLAAQQGLDVAQSALESIRDDGGGD